MQETNKIPSAAAGTAPSQPQTLKVPFQLPSLGREEENAVIDVMRSGWLTTGKVTLAFEKEFAAKVGSPYAFAVNSNTSGLILAMDACGIGPGTAIITTPYTFISTSTSARHLGADVLFADVKKGTYNIDPAAVEKLLKEDTAHKVKAIVPVHIAGAVCDMDALLALAKRYHVSIIEDAAHAFPCPTHNGYAGTIGDIGVFSFYATKTMTTAEGGMVCCKDAELAHKIEVKRMHGMDRTTWDRYTSPRASWEYDIIDLGYKCNLPDILSAIGREQLKKSDVFTQKRTAVVEKYNAAFSRLDFIDLPPTSEGNCWYMYIIRIRDGVLDIDRNSFAKELQKRGIGISMHFIPHYHFTYYNKLYPSFTAADYPNAEDCYRRSITIPLWPDMTEQMVCDVIEAVSEVGREHHLEHR